MKQKLRLKRISPIEQPPFDKDQYLTQMLRAGEGSYFDEKYEVVKKNVAC